MVRRPRNPRVDPLPASRRLVQPLTGRGELLAVLLVGLGGALGALARWGIDLLADHRGHAPPIATIVINVIGCALMGLLVAYVLSHPRRHPLWRPFLGVGLLGGFTTFSGFAADIRALLLDGDTVPATAYLLASVLGCLLALWAGYIAGRALRRRRT